MKTRVTFWLGAVTLVVALALWHVDGTPVQAAGDVQITVSTAAMMSAVGLGDDAEYIGSKKCKKCHLKQHKSWRDLKHGKALTLLEPGQASEAKSKNNLDPSKDYTKDEACLPCHTVGYGKPGGYAVPADEKAAKKAKSLAGVGCETCHGPGGAYLALHEEIKKSKRTYKVDEMLTSGLVHPDQSVCVKCHNDKSPTFDASKPFDFETMKDNGVHEHIPLKQREE